MAFWKVWFLIWQLIGLGLAKTDIPVAPVQAREFEAPGEDDPCPPDYKMFNNFCYQVNSTLTTWTEAEEVCTQKMRKAGQGNLVSILNKEEDDFVTGLWLETPPQRKRGCYGKVWIGLRDKDEEGNDGFLWSDGKSVSDYNNWATDQPKTECNKYCALLHRSCVWKTASCDRKLGFICKV